MFGLNIKKKIINIEYEEDLYINYIKKSLLLFIIYVI